MTKVTSVKATIISIVIDSHLEDEGILNSAYKMVHECYIAGQDFTAFLRDFIFEYSDSIKNECEFYSPKKRLFCPSDAAIAKYLNPELYKIWCERVKCYQQIDADFQQFLLDNAPIDEDFDDDDYYGSETMADYYHQLNWRNF